jgi:RNA recognition motif-containing protein
MIQASQAEKNRAAAASKYKKENDRGPDSHGGAGTLGGSRAQQEKKDFNTKVYVGGLIDVLNQVSESEIRQWFSPFGDIDSIELPKDGGRNKGHAIIEYNRHRDAKNAVKEMDGFDVLGRKLSCKIINDQTNTTSGGKPVMSLMQQQANKDLDLEEDSAS